MNLGSDLFMFFNLGGGAIRGSFEREVITEYSLMKGYDKPSGRVAALGIQSVIIGLGVDRTQSRGLIAHYPGHATVPDRDLFLRGLDASLNVSQDIIILFLKRLVVSCTSAEVEHKLGSANEGYCGSKPASLNVNLVNLESITYRGSTQRDYEKATPSIVAVERHSAGGVIHRISQGVEAKILDVPAHKRLLRAQKSMRFTRPIQRLLNRASHHRGGGLTPGGIPSGVIGRGSLGPGVVGLGFDATVFSMWLRHVGSVGAGLRSSAGRHPLNFNTRLRTELYARQATEAC